MIKKETFVNAINEIQEEQNKLHTFDSALSKVCDGHPVMLLGEGYLSALLKVLEETTDDVTGLIDWWLYDAPKNEKVIKSVVNGEETYYYLKTPENLYDYLEKSHEERKEGKYK